jgi:hypothetical protein
MGAAEAGLKSILGKFHGLNVRPVAQTQADFSVLIPWRIGHFGGCSQIMGGCKIEICMPKFLGFKNRGAWNASI